MAKNLEKKKELHYRLKIVCTLYGVILYTMGPKLIVMITDKDLSKNLSTTISLIIASLLCFWFLPKVIGVPKKEGIGQNLYNIGFRKVKKPIIHIALGLFFATCTLIAMYVGSLLTGEYIFDISTISFEQIYFSFLPGVFEEIIFRGFIMAIFLSLYKNIRKAAFVQCVVFVLLHIGSFEIDWLKFIDLFGVFIMAIAFTYVAYKTKNLLAGMIFHTIHDAFLFVVQPNQDIVYSPVQALYFYGCLMIGVVVVIFVTTYVAKRVGFVGDYLYKEV